MRNITNCTVLTSTKIAPIRENWLQCRLWPFKLSTLCWVWQLLSRRCNYGLSNAPPVEQMWATQALRKPVCFTRLDLIVTYKITHDRKRIEMVVCGWIACMLTLVKTYNWCVGSRRSLLKCLHFNDWADQTKCLSYTAQCNSSRLKILSNL